MVKQLFMMMGALVAGCAVGPDYVRPDTPAPAGWRVEYQAAAGLADLPWWRQFGDPVLDSLVETAVRNNLDLREATARIDQYRGKLETTRASFFPQTGGTVERNENHADNATVQINKATLNVNSWELDLWGRIRRSSEADQARIMASEAGRRATILTLVSDVASGYLTLRGLDRQLEIARDTERDQAEYLKLFQLRFRYGEISKLDLSQQESLYEDARKEIPRLESEIRQQENALSVLLGLTPKAIPRGQALDALTPPGIPAELPSQLLERRPDIIKAEQDLVAANAEIGAAKALYFPALTLTGALGVASGDIGRLLVSGTNTWNTTANLSGPILDFGNVAGQVKQQESLKEQALFQYQQKILTGFQEVEDALIKTTKGRERVESLTRQVQAYQEFARLSKLQFEAGESDYLAVLTANQNLFSARLSLTQQQSGLLVAVVSVYKAMGGGWITEADHLRIPEKNRAINPNNQGLSE